MEKRLIRPFGNLTMGEYLRRSSSHEVQSMISNLVDDLNEFTRTQTVAENEIGLGLNANTLKDLLLVHLLHTITQDKDIEPLKNIIKEFFHEDPYSRRSQR